MAVFKLLKNMENNRLKGARGCIIRGAVSLDDFSHCGDEKCPSCNMVNETLSDAFTDFSYMSLSDKYGLEKLIESADKETKELWAKIRRKYEK